MKICVLGVTGLLGTAIEKVCNEKNVECIGLSHADVEITDFPALKEMLDRHKPNVIINTAALIGIDPCEKKPLEAFRINTIVPYQLSRYCQERNVVFVQISTPEVFDGESESAYTEDDFPNPINVYGATKLMAEVLVKNSCDKHYIIRPSAMFGERNNDKKGYADKVFEWLDSKEIIKVADDKIDSPSYSTDLAVVLIKIVTDRKPYGIYHLANNGQASLYEFVDETAGLINKQINLSRAKVSDFPVLGRKPLRMAITSKKLPALRGWKDALAEYVHQLV
jgi:dTDP-4-dehydrorhamnose reductase